MSAPVPLLSRRTATLAPFVDAGVLIHSDVQVADSVGRLVPGAGSEVLLAVALAVRATRMGHVCVVLGDLPGSLVLDDAQPDAPRLLASLPWPDLTTWIGELVASEATAVVNAEPRVDAGVVDGAVRPVVFDGERVYLERYWRFERGVGDELLTRAGAYDPGAFASIGGAPGALDEILDRYFESADRSGPGSDLQRLAARRAITRSLVVIAGGPGTGKTRTVARLLAAAHEAAGREPPVLRVALAAPTGKAAARMTEAVRHEASAARVEPEIAKRLAEVEAVTIHRLLGGRAPAFRHHRRNPLAADLVVVDEASMVSLPLMARLVDAVRPDAHLVLVGDPYQLASIEAGAVLGDVVGRATAGERGGLGDSLVVLQRVHRFAADSAIAALAAAVRGGDADDAVELLRAGSHDVEWVLPDDEGRRAELDQIVVDSAVAVARAALEGRIESGLAAAGDLKVLAATRLGELGARGWTDRIESLAARAEPRLQTGRRWYVGRPVIVTRNDYLNRLVNGDTGLVVATDRGAAVAFHDAAVAEGVRTVAPSQISSVESWWAMTIHKSQGSEYRHAVVSLPPVGSPILTRELLYTAITRAKEKVTLVGSEEAIRAAVSRPIARASGLQSRLWP